MPVSSPRLSRRSSKRRKDSRHDKNVISESHMVQVQTCDQTVSTKEKIVCPLVQGCSFIPSVT